MLGFFGLNSTRQSLGLSCRGDSPCLVSPRWPKFLFSLLKWSRGLSESDAEMSSVDPLQFGLICLNTLRNVLECFTGVEVCEMERLSILDLLMELVYEHVWEEEEDSGEDSEEEEMLKNQRGQYLDTLSAGGDSQQQGKEG